MQKKSKVVVTGANGHVGNNLVRELVKQGYDVRATVRNINDPKKTKVLKELGVEIVQADLLDKESLVKAFTGCEGLFQIAAGFKMHTKDLDLDVRKPAIDGTINALEAAKEAMIKKIVYTSSVAAIGSSKVNEQKDESHWNDNASEFYAQCKNEAEKLLWKKAKELNLDVVTILPGMIIGPNFYQHTPSTYFFKKLLNGKIPMMLPVSFSYVDVRDVVSAHIKAYETKHSAGRYIACGDLISMKDVMGIFRDHDPSLKLPTKQAPKFLIPLLPCLDAIENKLTGNMRTMTKGVIDDYLNGTVQNFNKKKIKSDLGWQARPINETLIDTLNWIKLNNIP
ncbi:NAD-dependent epimerase/dehydratase family protein [Halobacteriovorax sp. HLS]|uniref:NAD-dependent epimerase/dehydratase family protein n=1 Tax=Halobacteriovorax sp. HLS TaxID=2234000 RepID=UPI000FD91C0E|nr:NAD-dependent epimerase/dehydratase family protein [Halobacteriovorax sp. HLS]